MLSRCKNQADAFEQKKDKRTDHLTPTQRDLKTRSELREIDSLWADIFIISPSE